jgi:hypothetical protein
MIHYHDAGLRHTFNYIRSRIVFEYSTIHYVESVNREKYQKLLTLHNMLSSDVI